MRWGNSNVLNYLLTNSCKVFSTSSTVIRIFLTSEHRLSETLQFKVSVQNFYQNILALQNYQNFDKFD